MPKIPLSNGGYTLVDDCDFDLSEFVWKSSKSVNSSSKLYAVRSVNHTQLELLHRVILGRVLGKELTRWEFVDHVDNDNTLDNRRFNLRLATPSQNAQNRKTPINSSSGYKGVSVYRGGLWQVRITCENVRHFLGNFASKKEAAQAYNEKAVELFGEFALLNEIKD